MNTYKIVKESLKRCGTSNEFYDTFYEVFLSKSEDIPKLFANTEFKKQKKLLKATITTMIRFPLDHKTTQSVLIMVAKTHNEDGYNIKPELYLLWLDSLCETVEKYDSEFTSEIESQWRKYMQEAIDVILANY